MSFTRSPLACVAAAALVLVAGAATAHADGLPLPVEESPNGVASSDGASRYLTVTLGQRTAILAQRTKTGDVRSRTELPGRFGIPLVAYDSSAGGLSADGRTLVLINPRSGFPRRTTTFAVFTAGPRPLRLRRILRLRGDFSYDALSRDGRSLFLINYVSATDPTKYRVRVYDLARNRLDPKPIVDPREAPDEMNGFALSRVDEPRRPLGVHALPGHRRQAVHPRPRHARPQGRLHRPPRSRRSRRGNPFELRLLAAARGARLDVRRRGALLATVDTATFRVRSGPAAVAAARPAVADNNAPGPHLLWPALGLALLGGVAASAPGRSAGIPEAQQRAHGQSVVRNAPYSVGFERADCAEVFSERTPLELAGASDDPPQAGMIAAVSMTTRTASFRTPTRTPSRCSRSRRSCCRSTASPAPRSSWPRRRTSRTSSTPAWPTVSSPARPTSWSRWRATTTRRARPRSPRPASCSPKSPPTTARPPRSSRRAASSPPQRATRR